MQHNNSLAGLSLTCPSQSELQPKSTLNAIPNQSITQDRYISSRPKSHTPGFSLINLSPIQNKSNLLKFQLQGQKTLSNCASHPKYIRPLPSQAQRILDAPDLVDDYYLNLLSWSSNNTLAVALKNKVYQWNGFTDQVNQLLEISNNDIICSVAYMPNSHILAIGDSLNNISVVDTEYSKIIRKFSLHNDRVSSLAWNGYILSSGSRDSDIFHHDLRIDQYFVKSQGHDQEVCGLQWSPDGKSLASGGNDNKLLIWDIQQAQSPQFQLNEHVAAVKALKWCPWQSNVLASGGGTADRTIKIWNTSIPSCIKTIETGSQVCALEWNQHDAELLSAHGYANNQLSLWRYKDSSKIADFVGHTSRVLYMAQNPIGSTVVTAAADETLRFWSIFESSVRMEKVVGTCLPQGISFNYR